jgi:Tfp pilus assembly protein PilZ
LEHSGRPVIPVEFTDRSAFLTVYHRDLSMGGLFVSTDSPAGLHETVVIELRIPLEGAPPLRFAAKVVHRLDPDAAVGGGRNVLAGMGVQMLDPDRVKAELAPILAGLRKQGG